MKRPDYIKVGVASTILIFCIIVGVWMLAVDQTGNDGLKAGNMPEQTTQTSTTINIPPNSSLSQPNIQTNATVGLIGQSGSTKISDTEQPSTQPPITYKIYFCDQRSVYYNQTVCDDSSNQQINISNKVLTSLPIDIFNGLENLTELYLQSNKLTSLEPNIFDNLINLKKLNISNNSLTSLPKEIFNKSISLEYLYLQSNKLTSLEPNIFNSLSDLKLLDISNNSLTSLPEEIFNELISLESLYLQSNKLTSLEPNNSFNILNSLSDLKLLDISNNGLTSLPKKIFDKLRYLEYLYLQSNKLASLEPKIFDSLSNLKLLDISNNKLTDLSKGIFDQNKILESLCLQSNEISKLEPIIFTGLKQLNLLNIEYNKFSLTEIDESILQILKQKKYQEFKQRNIIRNDICKQP